MNRGSTEMATARLIRKYRNRRLYDAKGHTYIKHINLLQNIAEGERIQVVQNGSGADVTRAVLFELLNQCDELTPTPQLDVAALLRMIKASVPNIPKAALETAGVRITSKST